MTKQIKPCPFTNHSVTVERASGEEYVIECKFCGYSMSMEDMEQLIDEWNNKASKEQRNDKIRY